MSDKQRLRDWLDRAGTDQGFRDAVGREMREDGADEQAIQEALARITVPTAVYATARDRRVRGERAIRYPEEAGAEVLTPEGVKRAARRLSGSNQGGRTDEVAGRLGEYASAIRALAKDGRYRESEITWKLILARLDRMSAVSQFWADVATRGGLQRFRADGLSGRFTGG